MTVILMVLMVKTLDMMIIMLFWQFDFNPLYIERLYAARVFHTGHRLTSPSS